MMTQAIDDPSGARGLLDKAEDAVGAMVGMASAATLGSHDAETYVTSACISDLYEIEAGRIALQRTASPQVRNFAQMLIEDHSRASEILLLKARLAALEAAAEPRLDERRKGMLDNLLAASDEEFDKVFLAQQTAAHQEALALHKGYGDSGANETLRGLASGSVPPLEQHLQMARHLSDQL
jgi:putative membrane protein